MKNNDYLCTVNQNQVQDSLKHTEDKGPMKGCFTLGLHWVLLTNLTWGSHNLLFPNTISSIPHVSPCNVIVQISSVLSVVLSKITESVQRPCELTT